MSDEDSLSLLDRLQPFILIAAVLSGLFVGGIYFGFSNYSDSILYFVIIVLVYSIMLGVPHEKIWGAYKNVRFFGLAWFVNFVIIPLIAWALALIFLGNHPAIYIGFILYLVTPCTDWFLLFTAARNSPLSLAIAFGIFPDQPLIQVAIIIGVLIELPLLIGVVRLLRIVKNKWYKEKG